MSKYCRGASSSGRSGVWKFIAVPLCCVHPFRDVLRLLPAAAGTCTEAEVALEKPPHKCQLFSSCCGFFPFAFVLRTIDSPFDLIHINFQFPLPRTSSGYSLGHLSWVGSHLGQSCPGTSNLEDSSDRPPQTFVGSTVLQCARKS